MPDNLSPRRRTRTLLLRAVTLGTGAALLGTSACGGSVGSAADAGSGEDARMVGTSGTMAEEAGHPTGVMVPSGGVDAGLSVADAGDASDASDAGDASEDVVTVTLGTSIPDAGSPRDAVSGTLVDSGGDGGPG